MNFKCVLFFLLILSPFDYSHCESHVGLQAVSIEEKINTLENFLERQVPGLTVSYQTVIQALMDEGWDVYITGGATRDLLAPMPREPMDVDINYSGTVEELTALLDRKHWQYTRIPGNPTITIGDLEGVNIEAVPFSVAFEGGEDSLEFTVTNIFYHTNKKALTLDSKVGLNDLSFRRLHILKSNLKEWLDRNRRHPYRKIYRSWNLIGKSFIYSSNFADFLKNEVLQKMENNPQLFREETLHYLITHNHNFDNVYHGAIAVMGYGWAKEQLLSLREEVQKKSIERVQQRGRFTRFKRQRDLQVPLKRPERR